MSPEKSKPYVLGLDLGVQSAGWAVIDLETMAALRRPPCRGPLFRERRGQRDRNRHRQGRVAERESAASPAPAAATLAARAATEEGLSFCRNGALSAGRRARRSSDTNFCISSTRNSRGRTLPKAIAWPPTCCRIGSASGTWTRGCRRLHSAEPCSTSPSGVASQQPEVSRQGRQRTSEVKASIGEL